MARLDSGMAVDSERALVWVERWWFVVVVVGCDRVQWDCKRRWKLGGGERGCGAKVDLWNAAALPLVDDDRRGDFCHAAPWPKLGP